MFRPIGRGLHQFPLRIHALHFDQLEVTAANGAGDHLILGVPAAGALAYLSANVPLPAFTNQTFCGQVQVAPQQIYPNVYVPTAAELSGNFAAFSGLLVNPATNQPYAQGVIPASQLGSVFAIRIGAPQTASPNQGWTPTGSLTTEGGSGVASVLLPSGQVLVVAGGGTPEIYNPLAGTLTPTGPTTVTQGPELQGTLLNNGSVLIVGGTTSPQVAELFNPAAGKFALTGPPLFRTDSIPPPRF